MATNIEIRMTRHEDVADLRRLIVNTWHDTYDDTIGPERVSEITDAWHAADRLGEEILNPDCTSLVAEHSGSIVGHGLLKRGDKGGVWLSRLYVLPPHQGAGIGLQLLTELECHLADKEELCLEVEESNDKARRFYQKHGFTLLHRKSSCGDQAEIPTLVLQKTVRSVVTNNKLV